MNKSPWATSEVKPTYKRNVKLETTPPAIYAIASAVKPFIGGANKYEQYTNFTKMDPELEAAFTRVALMAAYAYKGIRVRTGTQLDESEKNLQKLLDKFDEKFDIRDLFFAITYNVMRDGDDVYVGFYDTEGLIQLQPLPMIITTAINNRSQLRQFENVNTYISNARFYVINEHDANNMQVFPENNQQIVFHTSLSNRSKVVTDIMGRKTLGVWSESLLHAAESRLLWKQAILIADILWRYRNVPREEHILDLSMYNPDLFAGETVEARIAAAEAAAQTHVKKYIDSISKKNVDQGFVHDQSVEIKYVEPKETTWHSPNDLIEQINKSIFNLTSVSEASAGRGGGTYATELVIASYTILLPEFLVYKVKRTILKIVKEHIRRISAGSPEYTFTEEQIDQIDIKTSLILQIMQGELVRQIAVLAATGSFTIDELRELIGKDPLTDEQINRLIQIVRKSGGRTGQFAQTLFDIVASESRQEEPTPHNETPESRQSKQTT